MKKGAAIFSILMGVTMTGTWLFLFISEGVPQVRTLPVETGYLLTAEFLTAGALVVGGYGVLSHQKWAMSLLLVALGQLIYCVIRYAGELGRKVAGQVWSSSAWLGQRDSFSPSD